MLKLEITDHPGSGDVAVLVSAIAQEATAKNAPPYSRKPLGVFMRDEQSNIVAGLDGATFWDLLYIDNLWVSKQQRGKGLGTSLVQSAELKALERGCHSAYLWTQNYEAPVFYRKLGYQQFVVMEDVPPGHQRIGFMKRLAA